MKQKPRDLTDGRKIGHWQSRYPISAWVQIAFEVAYLVLITIGSAWLIIDGASVQPLVVDEIANHISTIFGWKFNQSTVRWLAFGLSGLIGGSVFALKWEYHAVAKGTWNRDRLCWRLIVPINSSMVAFFTGCLMASGIIPLIESDLFVEQIPLLGLGFFFGFASDHILGFLQSLAIKIFGTIKSYQSSDSREK